MRRIDEYREFRTKVLQERTTHILCVGFEDRCVAYPRFLAGTKPSADKHTCICLAPQEGGLGGTLRERTALHKAEIQNALPGTSFSSPDALEDKIRGASVSENYCVDLSSMPRQLIFRVLSTVLDRAESSACTYIVYTIPKLFAHGCLQQPGYGAWTLFTNPRLEENRKVTVLIFPGFDREYTNVALAHVAASTHTDPSLLWFFPFPGRKYAFYQRSMEAHFELIEDTVALSPPYEIMLAFESLKKQVSALRSERMFFVPLGPRSACVSIHLAVAWARKQGFQANVLLPLTRKYTSLRSEGYEVPLIERIIRPSPPF